MGSARTTALARRRRKRSRGPRRALAAPAETLQRALAKAPLQRKRALPARALSRPSWKLVGLAGIAGVAATGVVVARNRRAHSDLPPDELRNRLHERLAAIGADDTDQQDAPA